MQYNRMTYMALFILVLSKIPYPVLLVALLLPNVSCEPTDSGDNALQGKLAFVSRTDRNLYTQDLDGTNRQRIYLNNITDNINQEPWGPLEDSLWSKDLNLGQPRWSPDGTKLAIVAGIYEQSELIILDLGTGSGKVVSFNFFDVASPDWSPDGSKIAYSMSTSTWSTFTEVFVTDLVNDTLYQITHLSDQVGNLIAPRWSSNGEEIFFSHSASPDSLRNVYAYSVNTGNIAIIATWPYTIFISRDGKILLGYKGISGIFRYDIPTQQETALTITDNDQDPRLFDSDNWVIFTRFTNMDPSVWLMTINGEELQPVADANGITFTADYLDIWLD